MQNTIRHNPNISWLLQIGPDGVVTFNPELKPDEAAQGAWNILLSLVHEHQSRTISMQLQIGSQDSKFILTPEQQQRFMGKFDETIWQLFTNGPTADGNLIDKEQRYVAHLNGLVERAYGWNWLTADGMKLAFALGYGVDSEKGKRKNV